MINNSVLVGRLTKDPELTKTTNGVAKVQFTLAVNRSFSNQNGERETDFILCSAWRKTAENMAQFLRKGSLIGVTGRISTRNYEGKDGNRVYVTEVIAEGVEFLEPKNDNEQKRETQSNGQQQNYSQQTQQQNYQPQNNQQQQQSNQQQNYQQQQHVGVNSGYGGQQGNGEQNGFYPSDDDLPF